MKTIESRCTIDANHPSLAGHFPGNPIVPGVVILDCVLQTLREQWNDSRPAQIQDAKFTSPLLPDEPMHIRINLRNEQSAGFECRVDERLIAQGRIALERIGA